MNEYKKKLAALVALSLLFSAVGIYTPAVHTHTAEAAVYEVEQKSACPEGGEPTAIGAAGCSSCGGRGITYIVHQNIKDQTNFASDGPFQGQSFYTFTLGSGYETKTVDSYTYAGVTYYDVTLYYRCHNCGVCEKYSKLVYFSGTYKKSVAEGVTQDVFVPKKECGAERGPGEVPQRWCSKCGPKISDPGANGPKVPNVWNERRNDWETQAMWAQWHIKKVPTTKPTNTPKPPTNTPKPPTNTPTPKPTNTPTPVPTNTPTPSVTRKPPATPKADEGSYEVIYVYSDGTTESKGGGTFTKVIMIPFGDLYPFLNKYFLF